ncbi:MAG: hypothetical protein IPH41_03145 [Sulfuritalea sp.]|nr:hypothetical protein [Sulfuritalea sp.]MBP9219637.1 hypothetical protein [Sterolibacterium sp.]
MTGADAAPWWVHGVTWLVVAAGWYTVHRATLSRERRREKRDAAKQLASDLHELEKSAREFHSAERHDEYAAAELSMRCDRLIKVVQRAPFDELKIAPSLMTSLRRAVTCHNIDRTAFSQQAANSEIQRNIRCAIDDLIDAIEEAKVRTWA